MNDASILAATPGKVGTSAGTHRVAMTQVRVVHVGGSDADQQTFAAIADASGAFVVRALAAFEALAELDMRVIDVLVIDVMQPSSDVLALMRAAATQSTHGRAVPVVVTGGLDAMDRIAACLRRGADDYVTTPFDPSHDAALLRRLEHVIERHPLLTALPPRLPSSDVLTQRIPVSQAPPQVAIGKPDQSYIHRFVPREFLDRLDRESLADVKLGDHVEHEMTVFFSDIRDFTFLSESLTPQQNFSFLTSYLRNVTPIIRRNGGFVDKYLGDGVMALFPGDAIDAVRSSVELLIQLERYNLGRKTAGYVPIRVGMGMHRGPLMLGTIGAEDQMQTTVIADAVNLAARIEGMTKTFGVNMLLSDSVVNKLPPDHAFKLRCLGAVKAKGKTQSIEIYECYDNDAAHVVEHKERTTPQFIRAIDEYRKGKLLTAGKIFSRIAEMEPSDTVAAYFRDRCALSVLRDRGAGAWDGSDHLEVK